MATRQGDVGPDIKVLRPELQGGWSGRSGQLAHDGVQDDPAQLIPLDDRLHMSLVQDERLVRIADLRCIVTAAEWRRNVCVDELGENAQTGA